MLNKVIEALDRLAKKHSNPVYLNENDDFYLIRTALTNAPSVGEDAEKSYWQFDHAHRGMKLSERDIFKAGFRAATKGDRNG